MDTAQEENKEIKESLSIGDITAPSIAKSLSSSDDPAEAAREEIAAYDRLQNAKAAAAEEYVEVLKQDRNERGKYADKLFKLVCV